MKRGEPKGGVALSIRQPWATLVIVGLKTIEVRRWKSNRTGLVAIHAGLTIDRRPEAWRQLPSRYRDLAEQRGGLVGLVEMVSCKRYETRRSFADDARHHLNSPRWFEPPALHGFVFENARLIPFQSLKGELHFFQFQLVQARISSVTSGKP